MKGERRVPFFTPSAMNNAVLTGMHFRSSDKQGEGIVSFQDVMPWCTTEGVDFPVVVRIQFALSSGKVYCEYFDVGFHRAISESVSSREGEGEIFIYLEKPENGAVLMIGVIEGPVDGEIKAVFVAPRSAMEPAEYKRVRANMFSHWYSSCDLGDGVYRLATVQDEKLTTRAALKNRAILLSMVDKYIGSVNGLRVLDVACSSGLHSFELARRGAIVTGIDWDPAAITQAKFIQECIGGKFQHPVVFCCTDLFAFEPAPGSFDLVYCSGLFYHLQDPIGAARRLASWCTRWAVIQSSVAAREEDLFELSYPGKFPFCASWEFALVPTATMLRKVFEHAGFGIEGLTDLSEFLDDNATWINYRPKNNQILCGPVYLALSIPRGRLPSNVRSSVEAIKNCEQQLAQLALEKRALELSWEAVQNSVGWRLLNSWRRKRDRWLPGGSFRRKAYDSVLKIGRNH